MAEQTNHRTLLPKTTRTIDYSRKKTQRQSHTKYAVAAKNIERSVKTQTKKRIPTLYDRKHNQFHTNLLQQWLMRVQVLLTNIYTSKASGTRRDDTMNQQVT